MIQYAHDTPHTIQPVSNNPPNTIQQLRGQHMNEQTMLLTSLLLYCVQSLHFFIFFLSHHF